MPDCSPDPSCTGWRTPSAGAWGAGRGWPRSPSCDQEPACTSTSPARGSSRHTGAKITIFCGPGPNMWRDGVRGPGRSRDYVTTQWRQRGLGGNPSWAFLCPGRWCGAGLHPSHIYVSVATTGWSSLARRLGSILKISSLKLRLKKHKFSLCFVSHCELLRR